MVQVISPAVAVWEVVLYGGLGFLLFGLLAAVVWGLWEDRNDEKDVGEDPDA